MEYEQRGEQPWIHAELPDLELSRMRGFPKVLEDTNACSAEGRLGAPN